MFWRTVRGTVLNKGLISNQARRVEQTVLVETESGQRILIAPEQKVLNKLSTGDVIEFETQEGKDAKLTWFLGRLKRNCRKLRVVSQ
jgi:hypothetical protein